MMWFTQLATVQNPGRTELQGFVDATWNFLAFALAANELSFLWEDDKALLTLALETFNADVKESASELRAAIPNLQQDTLKLHGLTGRPMRFKFRVMDTIALEWNRVRNQFSVRDWFKRIIEAIDAALGSLIAAAGGAGGLLKEFKDALLSLAKSVR